MKQRKDIEQNIQLMGHPEEIESLLAHQWMSEDENDNNHDVKHDASQTSQRLEQPIANGGFAVRREVQFLGQTVKMFNRLGAHVVEVDQMADGVQNREE